MQTTLKAKSDFYSKCKSWSIFAFIHSFKYVYVKMPSSHNEIMQISVFRINEKKDDGHWFFFRGYIFKLIAIVKRLVLVFFGMFLKKVFFFAEVCGKRDWFIQGNDAKLGNRKKRCWVKVFRILQLLISFVEKQSNHYGEPEASGRKLEVPL